MLRSLLRRRVIRIIIFIFCLFLIVSLLRSITTLWQRAGVVSEEEERLGKLKKKNEELQKQYEESRQLDFIEKQAREKLNMSREGEVVVILPKLTSIPTPTPTPYREIWQQWLKVLGFGKRS